MTDAMVSTLPDADMQAAPKALLRAAQRAREIARQTNTRLVLVRAGELVEEIVTDPQPAAPEARRVT
jgi:2-keto-3-deoxy-galactonokinase